MSPCHWLRRNRHATPDPQQLPTDLEVERELLKNREARTNRVVASLRRLQSRNQFREQILLTVEEAARRGH